MMPSDCVTNQEEFTMTTPEFIGIDVAKDKFDGCLLKEDGSLVQKMFPNTPSGFEAFVLWTKEQCQTPWVCMEATGHYSEILAEALVCQGIKVSVVNPVQIKYFAKVKLSRNKNDKVDAKIIAHYAHLMNPPLFKPRSPAQKYVRELIQLEDTLRTQRTQLKLQLSCTQSGIAHINNRKATLASVSLCF
jgi:transposase